MLGNGDGTFLPPVTYSTGGYTYATVGDFDGDGKIDLVCNVNGGSIFVFPGNGDGTFRVSGPILNAQFGGALTVADFNGDGKADLAVNYWGIPILFGNGDGTFQPPVPATDSTAALSAIADFNGDGIPDLLTVGDNGFTVLLGNGSGMFTPAANLGVDSDDSAATAVVGDFNGDGKLDLIIVTAGPPAYSSVPMRSKIDFYPGLGDGTFGARITVLKFDNADLTGPIAVTDFNGDGILDLAVLSNYDSVTVLQGRGDGTFSQSFSAILNNQPSSSVLACDLSGDGRSDLAAAGNFGLTTLLGVQRPSPTTTLTSSSPSIAYGNYVTLTATVSPASATGSITFSDGAAILSKVPLSSGQATFTTNLFNAGEHSLTAAYSGDTTFYISTSPTLVQSIAPAVVTTALTSSANPASIAESVLLTATLSPSLATGSVTFLDGGATLAIRTLANGKASLPIATLLPGVHFLKAFYNGDANVPPAASPILSQTITSPSPSQITLTSSSNPATLGQPVTLAATVPGPGNVTFYDGAQILGTQPKFTTNQLAAGTHSLRAYYSGDATHSPATSPVLTQTIRALPAPAFLPPIKTSLTADPLAFAIADFNADGKPDFAVVDFRGVHVFLGHGDGTFATPWTFDIILPSAVPVTAALLATGDFNGDGKPDLAMAYGFAGYPITNISIFLGNGDGTFQPSFSYVPGTSLASLAVVDLNGDGRADIVAGAPGSLLTLVGNGDGTFQPVIYPLPGLNLTALLAGDFNADGIADLAVIDTNQSTVDILLGAGNGTFRQPASYTAGTRPRSLAIADFNQDGKPDLAVANDDGSISILFGKPDGTFSPAVTRPGNFPGTSAVAIAVGDWNADGKPDLALSSQSYVGVLWGNGDGTFRELAYYSPGTSLIATADFNGDGLTDVLTGSDGGSSMSVLLGSSAAQAPASVLAIANAATSVLGSPVTQGSLAAIFGSFPDPTAISVHTGVLNAPVLSATSSKVVFQVPWPLSGGKTNVTVTANGRTTAPLNAELQTFAPGIFTIVGDNPAIPGKTILQIYCTGLGPVTHQPATGVSAGANPLSQTELDVTVGFDRYVPALFSGLVPGLIGVYQVNAQVPAGILPNPSLPVIVVIGNNVSNAVNIAVQAPSQ
jgi:uncharacterized protein (TIGR03437 family)